MDSPTVITVDKSQIKILPVFLTHPVQVNNVINKNNTYVGYLFINITVHFIVADQQHRA